MPRSLTRCIAVLLVGLLLMEPSVFAAITTPHSPAIPPASAVFPFNQQAFAAIALWQRLSVLPTRLGSKVRRLQAPYRSRPAVVTPDGWILHGGWERQPWFKPIQMASQGLLGLPASGLVGASHQPSEQGSGAMDSSKTSLAEKHLQNILAALGPRAWLSEIVDFVFDLQTADLRGPTRKRQLAYAAVSGRPQNTLRVGFIDKSELLFTHRQETVGVELSDGDGYRVSSLLSKLMIFMATAGLAYIARHVSDVYATPIGLTLASIGLFAVPARIDQLNWAANGGSGGSSGNADLQYFVQAVDALNPAQRNEKARMAALDDLEERGMLSPHVRMDIISLEQKNILIVGPGSSGKSALAEFLLAYHPEAELAATGSGIVWIPSRGSGVYAVQNPTMDRRLLAYRDVERESHSNGTPRYRTKDHSTETAHFPRGNPLPVDAIVWIDVQANATQRTVTSAFNRVMSFAPESQARQRLLAREDFGSAFLPHYAVGRPLPEDVQTNLMRAPIPIIAVHTFSSPENPERFDRKAVDLYLALHSALRLQQLPHPADTPDTLATSFESGSPLGTVYLSSMPDQVFAGTNLRTNSLQIMRAVEKTKFPGLTQGRLGRIQAMLDGMTPAQMALKAIEVGIQLQGQDVLDVLAQLNYLTPEAVELYRTDLEESQPQVREMFDDGLWTWEIYARLLSNHPFREPVSAGAALRWLYDIATTPPAAPFIDLLSFVDLLPDEHVSLLDAYRSANATARLRLSEARRALGAEPHRVAALNVASEIPMIAEVYNQAHVDVVNSDSAILSAAGSILRNTVMSHARTLLYRADATDVSLKVCPHKSYDIVIVNLDIVKAQRLQLFDEIDGVTRQAIQLLRPGGILLYMDPREERSKTNAVNQKVLQPVQPGKFQLYRRTNDGHGPRLMPTLILFAISAALLHAMFSSTQMPDQLGAVAGAFSFWPALLKRLMNVVHIENELLPDDERGSSGKDYPRVRRPHDVWQEVEVIQGGRPGPSLMPDEKLALVDPISRRPTGTFLERWLAHSRGVWHMVVHVYLIDRYGRFILQRRSLNIINSPGKIQVSASGHVDASDVKGAGDLAVVQTTANREGIEEVGIPLTGAKLISGINQVRRDVFDNRELVTVLVRYVSEEELSQMQRNYNRNEVSELLAIPVSNLKDLVRRHGDEFSGSIRHLVEKEPDILNKLIALAPPFISRFENAARFNDDTRFRIETQLHHLLSWWMDENSAGTRQLATRILSTIRPMRWSEMIHPFFVRARELPVVTLRQSVRPLYAASAVHGLIILVAKGFGLITPALAIGIVLSAFVTGPLSLLIKRVLWPGGDANRSEIVLNRYSLFSIESTLSEEVIHFLAAQAGSTVKDLPFAHAAAILIDLQAGIFRPGTKLYRSIMPNIAMGRMLAQEPISQAKRLEKAFQWVAKRTDTVYDGRRIETWTQAQIQADPHAAIAEPRWTYILGEVIAGLLYEQSVLTAGKEGGWSELRRLMKEAEAYAGGNPILPSGIPPVKPSRVFRIAA
jgi:isopentenyldiphosphate isomerase